MEGQWMSDLQRQLDGLRALYGLIGKINAGRTLASTLQAVVDGVVAGLDFAVAAVSYVHADGTFEVVAVAGSEEARGQLLGSRLPAHAFDAEFAVAERWGRLRFVSHDRMPETVAESWVPSASALTGPDKADAWHPLDALFAPLHSPTGQLVGVLSVDLPAGGRIPGAVQRELLEMFATQAGIAIDNAQLSEQLSASEEAFRLAFDGAGIGMTLISLDAAEPGRFLRVNDAMCAITGYGREELLARTFTDITHPADRDQDHAAYAEAVTGGDAPVYRAEKRYLRPDGAVVWVAITTTVVRTASGEMRYGITQVEDISARRADVAELRHRAGHDPLTGLVNRAMLTDQLTELMSSATGSTGNTRSLIDTGEAAVLFCDLDRFKPVNDTFGHDVGDAVLRIVAARLREQVRDHDTVSRFGGDEFVILARQIGRADSEQLAERIERSIAEPITIGQHTMALTVSIGIARVPEDVTHDDVIMSSSTAAAAVLRVADLAMYQAKAAGRNGHVVVDAAVIG
jgi:diguanylate cyclase (GGDEF)-like protein/PAS domain S-box-containing protein